MAKFGTQAVIPESSPFSPNTKPWGGAHRASWAGPSVLSQQQCCSPGPCCFLDMPCSCKPPRLCSRCSHDLKGPSPALALIPLTLTFSLQLTTQAHLSRLNPMLIFSKTLILIQGSVLFFFCSYQEPQTLQDRLEYCLKNTPAPPFPSSPRPLWEDALPCPTAPATPLALAGECEKMQGKWRLKSAAWFGCALVHLSCVCHGGVSHVGSGPRRTNTWSRSEPNPPAWLKCSQPGALSWTASGDPWVHEIEKMKTTALCLWEFWWVTDVSHFTIVLRVN